MKDQYNILDKEKSTKEHYVIRESVTEINNGAFRDCIELVSIEIPHSITKIGNEAFSCCKNLTSINVFSLNNTYMSIDGVLYKKGMNELVAFPAGKRIESYTIPKSVTTLYNYAFAGCGNSFSGYCKLNSLIIHKDIKKIGQKCFLYCNTYFEVHFQSNDPYSINVQLNGKDISKILLFVPIGTVYAYKRHPEFSKFKHIKSENIRNV